MDSFLCWFWKPRACVNRVLWTIVLVDTHVLKLLFQLFSWSQFPYIHWKLAELKNTSIFSIQQIYFFYKWANICVVATNSIRTMLPKHCTALLNIYLTLNHLCLRHIHPYGVCKSNTLRRFGVTVPYLPRGVRILLCDAVKTHTQCRR